MLISTGIMLDSCKIMDGGDHIRRLPPSFFFSLNLKLGHNELLAEYDVLFLFPNSP